MLSIESMGFSADDRVKCDLPLILKTSTVFSMNPAFSSGSRNFSEGVGPKTRELVAHSGGHLFF